MSCAQIRCKKLDLHPYRRHTPAPTRFCRKRGNMSASARPTRASDGARRELVKFCAAFESNVANSYLAPTDETSTMDMDLKDIIDFLQTTARSVGAEVTSPWFYLQFGLILAAAGAGLAAGAAIRSRVGSRASWPSVS
jgi:hypothetical protein